MKRSVLISVVLALAAGCAGPVVRGEATLPAAAPAPLPPVEATASPGSTVDGAVAPAPVPQPRIRFQPIPEVRATDAMPAQDETPREPAQPVAAESPSDAPLDLAALKARLRDTSAIGFFTKIALKNQVDDLVEKFRAYHIDRQSGAITALRQPYDLLVLKVLALIQDSDPSLANSIVASREAIWGILADRDKFNSVA